jgi:hypothetical protein
LFLAIPGLKLLLGRLSTAWAMPPALFALVILEIQSHCKSRTSCLAPQSYFMLSAVAEMTEVWDYTQLFSSRDGVLQTFFLGWPWTTVLLISASQVARMKGVSHQYLAYFLFFN